MQAYMLMTADRTKKVNVYMCFCNQKQEQNWVIYKALMAADKATRDLDICLLLPLVARRDK
jgi:hypothetical protein